MAKKIRVLKRHFDEAVKHPWSTKTCVIAQCARDHGHTYKEGDKVGDILMENGQYIAPYGGEAETPGRQIMSKFDGNFKQPGDEKTSTALQELRASLPITLQ